MTWLWVLGVVIAVVAAIGLFELLGMVHERLEAKRRARDWSRKYTPERIMDPDNDDIHGMS